MPAIEIRAANALDIADMIKLDHNYTTDHVWQMDLEKENGEIEVRFREVRLPRPVQVDYPRSKRSLIDDWSQRSGLLVALHEEKIVGYVSLKRDVSPNATWMTDLVVSKPLRRQGVGSALVLAAQEWVLHQTDNNKLLLELQSKNYPAISLCQKLGFDFSGYDDRHFRNNDIAIFFAKWLG
jgi:GNAT superfamily N-acetyltransferase